MSCMFENYDCYCKPQPSHPLVTPAGQSLAYGLCTDCRQYAYYIWNQTECTRQLASMFTGWQPVGYKPRKNHLEPSVDRMLIVSARRSLVDQSNASESEKFAARELASALPVRDDWSKILRSGKLPGFNKNYWYCSVKILQLTSPPAILRRFKAGNCMIFALLVSLLGQPRSRAIQVSASLTCNVTGMLIDGSRKLFHWKS